MYCIVHLVFVGTWADGDDGREWKWIDVIVSTSEPIDDKREAQIALRDRYWTPWFHQGLLKHKPPERGGYGESCIYQCGFDVPTDEECLVSGDRYFRKEMASIVRMRDAVRT